MLPPLSPQASCHNLKAFDLIIILIFFVTIIIITISIIIIIIYISILPFPPNLTNQIILEHFTLSQSSAEISRNSWSIVGLVGGHWVQMGQVSLKSVKRTTRQVTVHFIFPSAQLLTPRPKVITVWGDWGTLHASVLTIQRLTNTGDFNGRTMWYPSHPLDQINQTPPKTLTPPDTSSSELLPPIPSSSDWVGPWR